MTVISPNSASQFANDRFAEFLFNISSELPEPLRQEAMELDIPAELWRARCFAYNADEHWMIRLLNFWNFASYKRWTKSHGAS